MRNTLPEAGPRQAAAPSWQRLILVLAGGYNLLWGALVVAFPGLLFRLLDMAPPRYPSLWQCVGMIVGVYGVGYLIAARNPWRHWPIVLVGLLGKVFGPMGFVLAAARGELPWSLGWTIVTNDLIWWAPFVMILWGALSDAQRRLSPEHDAGEPLAPEIAMERMHIDAGPGAGTTLLELSRDQRLLVVFLRHAGCTFCREALDDLRTRRADIESGGARIVLVHMGSDEEARAFFGRYELDDVARIADPQRTLYRAFELRRGTFTQLFGLRVTLRGILAGVRGHGVGSPNADAFQLTGAFVVVSGRIVAGRPHRNAADRPDYAGLACGLG